MNTFVENFKSRFNKLDILINNAGIWADTFSKNKAGTEFDFAVNHVGHFALTLGLFDVLKNTPQSRIINVSSKLHY